jgi:catechol 2,3-dioxygenase-like lactoylglutathione lyase family enzyme
VDVGKGDPMKPPILNHIALTVPRRLVSDTPQRRSLLEFYEAVFGWRAIDVMGIEGERLVLHLHQLTHFLYLVGGDVPATLPSGDHFGIEVYDREALLAIVERAKAFKAERDPAVEIDDVAQEDYGSIRIHNAYIRYLLPLKVEVQFYEGVEAHVEDV